MTSTAMNLLSILLLPSLENVDTFALSHCHFMRSSIVATGTDLHSAPIRKSGSLFGLTDYTSQKKSSSNNSEPVSEEKITETNSTITILKPKIRPEKEWEDALDNELDVQLQDSEEEVDEIADSLLTPPALVENVASRTDLIINGSFIEMSTDTAYNMSYDTKEDRNLESKILSPTHSIQEDYEAIRRERADSLDTYMSSNDDDKEEDKQFPSEISVDKQDITSATRNTNEKSNKQFIDKEGATALEMRYSKDTKQIDFIQPKINNDPSKTISSLEAILASATSLLSPQPPFEPPTVSITINSNKTTSNLIETNNHLQQKSHAQREDLERLHRKINDLEQQLIQVRRSKVTQVEEEVDTRVAMVRNEFQQKMTHAVERLEKEVNKLTVELNESAKKLLQTEEAKERVAAEYGFIAKAHTDEKHMFDAQRVEWEEKIETLETELNKAATEIEQYQYEAQRWKGECISKANLLNSSTTRIFQLKSDIDAKEEEIKRLLTTEAREMERKLSDAKREMRNEYEELLSKKSKKISEVRTALRSANEKRRRVESMTQRNTAEALNELHTQMTGEVNKVKSLLEKKEAEMNELREKAEEAEVIVEGRERLLAEMMYLAANAQKNEDILQSYKEKTSKLQQINTVKSDEIGDLKLQVKQLNASLKKEKSLSAGNEMELNDLIADLGRSDAFVKHLNQQLDSSRIESQTYQRKVDDLEGRMQQLERDKNSLEESLADEKDRLLSALDDKTTTIAILEQEMAEKINEMYTLNTTLGNVTSRLGKVTSQHALEKKRVNTLEEHLQLLKQNITRTVAIPDTPEKIGVPFEVYKRKVHALTQQNLLSQHVINSKLYELAKLKARFDEMSRTTSHLPAELSVLDESRKTIAELKSQLDLLSSSSRQNQARASEKLLLQNKVISEQQSIIGSLTSKIKDLEESSLEKNESAINELQMELDNTKTDFSTWKARSDEKILNADNNLKSKEQEILQLKKEINDMTKYQEEVTISSLEALEEKSKEKLRQKNKILKERDDVITQLNTQLNDLEFEKEKINHKLQDEKQRNEEFYRNYEMQLQATEDKLRRKHAADMSELENEMNNTVYQLKMQVTVLNEKIADTEALRSQRPFIDTQDGGSISIQELQVALQQSKEKEVNLINKNMMMKNQIDNLEAQKKLLVMSTSDAVTRQERKNVVELPSYYQDSKRARFKRVVGTIWRWISRRQQ